MRRWSQSAFDAVENGSLDWTDRNALQLDRLHHAILATKGPQPSTQSQVEKRDLPCRDFNAMSGCSIPRSHPGRNVTFVHVCSMCFVVGERQYHPAHACPRRQQASAGNCTCEVVVPASRIDPCSKKRGSGPPTSGNGEAVHDRLPPTVRASPVSDGGVTQQDTDFIPPPRGPPVIDPIVDRQQLSEAVSVEIPNFPAIRHMCTKDKYDTDIDTDPHAFAQHRIRTWPHPAAGFTMGQPTRGYI